MKKNSIVQSAVTKHTAFQTILLHLTPGLIQLFIMCFFVFLSLRLGFAGLEGQLAGSLVDVLALMPLQIGFLLFAAKKTTNTYHISKLIPFQKKSKLWEYLVFCVIMIAWALFIDTVLSPLEHGLRDTVFSFIPEQLEMRNVDYSALPKEKTIFVVCFSIFANGFIAPITEEVYFRGYLLPRINLSPKLAVLVNAVLFSVYHFFSPWYFLSRLLMTLPIYYWVVRKKNIRFSLMAHMIANLYTSISLLLSVI